MANQQISDRQVNAEVSALIAGVGWGQEFIGDMVAPSVDAGAEKFLYVMYNNEGLEDVGNAKRGLRANTKRVEPIKYSPTTATLDEYALMSTIDMREFRAAQVIDSQRQGQATNGLSAVDTLRYGTASLLQHDIQIQKEKAIAAAVFNPANYDSTLRNTTSDGNAYAMSSSATIIPDILDRKRQAGKLYGYEPDTFVLGWSAFKAIQSNSYVLDRIRYGGSMAQPANVTEDVLAQIFGLRRVVIGKAVSQTISATPGTPGTATALWTEDSAALIYSGVNPNPASAQIYNQQGNPNTTAAAGNAFTTANLWAPVFIKLFYMTLPSTGVRYEVRTWLSDNGKLENLEVTEFFLPQVIMHSGFYFANVT